MKFAKVILIVYCVFIGGVALLDFVAQPYGQPLKNVATVITMVTTLAGIFLKRKEFLFVMPAYTIFYAGFAAAEAGNISAAIGTIAGLSLPLVLVYLNFKYIKTIELTKK